MVVLLGENSLTVHSTLCFPGSEGSIMVKASLGTFLKKGVQEKLGARTRSPLGAGAAETPGTVPLRPAGRRVGGCGVGAGGQI